MTLRWKEGCRQQTGAISVALILMLSEAVFGAGQSARRRNISPKDLPFVGLARARYNLFAATSRRYGITELMTGPATILFHVGKSDHMLVFDAKGRSTTLASYALSGKRSVRGWQAYVRGPAPFPVNGFTGTLKYLLGEYKPFLPIPSGSLAEMAYAGSYVSFRLTAFMGSYAHDLTLPNGNELDDYRQRDPDDKWAESHAMLPVGPRGEPHRFNAQKVAKEGKVVPSAVATLLKGTG